MKLRTDRWWRSRISEPQTSLYKRGNIQDFTLSTSKLNRDLFVLEWSSCINGNWGCLQLLLPYAMNLEICLHSTVQHHFETFDLFTLLDGKMQSWRIFLGGRSHHHATRLLVWRWSSWMRWFGSFLRQFLKSTLDVKLFVLTSLAPSSHATAHSICCVVRVSAKSKIDKKLQKFEHFFLLKHKVFWANLYY